MCIFVELALISIYLRVDSLGAWIVNRLSLPPARRGREHVLAAACFLILAVDVSAAVVQVHTFEHRTMVAAAVAMVVVVCAGLCRCVTFPTSSLMPSRQF